MYTLILGDASKEENVTQLSLSDGPISDVVPSSWILLSDRMAGQDATAAPATTVAQSSGPRPDLRPSAVTENRRLPSGTRFKETDESHVNSNDKRTDRTEQTDQPVTTLLEKVTTKHPNKSISQLIMKLK